MTLSLVMCAPSYPLSGAGMGNVTVPYPTRFMLNDTTYSAVSPDVR